ncbi:MAG: hypothetical protein KAX13_12945 [Candidatus Krumholzibacteria bacterium]|nr:hypothetical protein [Candidatus Krumholzibacteria bacterium]
MDTEPAVLGWGFWWRWVLLTIFGRAVGFIVGFLLGHIVLGNVSVGIGEGAIVGLCQWFLLKRYIPHSAKWIPATIIGLFVPLGLYGAAWLIWRISFDLGWPMGGLGWAGAYLVGGAFMGWMQLPILRRRIADPKSWVFFSAIGWCLSIFPMMIRADMTGDLPIPLIILRNGIMSPAFAGLVLGAITGWGLMVMLRRPAPTEQA